MKQDSSKNANRIHILDIIRGIAILGIFTMNLPLMAFPGDLSDNYLLTDPERGWGYWIGITFDIIFLDKMRGLFTVLFGVSSVLIIRKLEKNVGGLDASYIYFRRLSWLLVIGLIHAYIFLWYGEVLFTYAILGMFLFPFVKAPRSVLVAAQLACLSVLTIQPLNDYLGMLELQKEYEQVQGKEQSGEELTSDDEETIEEWEETIAEVQLNEEEIEEEVEAKAGSYPDVFKYNKDDVVEEETTELYLVWFWDGMLYMLLGIMLFQKGFFDDDVRRTVHFLIAVFGTGMGLATHAWLYIFYYENFSDPVNSLYYLIFSELGRLPFVLGYISLIIVVFRTRIFSRLGNWLAATGQMALTNYLVQSIIGALVVYGFGLSQFNKLDRVEIVVIILMVWVFQIMFSLVWMKYFKHGPFEWAWRSLTYWKVQPLLIARPLQPALG